MFAAGYLYVFITGLMRDARDGQPLAPKPLMALVSFIANFFDTLGVGSYATTTSMVRFFKLMPDEKIPGSLNVGYVLPTMIQAYVTIHGVSGLGVTVPPVEVDPLTLISLIAAAILGAWLGAGVVSSWPRRKIQLGMGLCLAAAAIIMLVRLTVFHSLEVGATGLTGVKLVIGIVGLFGLGALMTLGIGLYAPCLILVTLLGMNDKSGLSDHDGRVRVPHAGRGRSVHPRAGVLRAGDALDGAAGNARGSAGIQVVPESPHEVGEGRGDLRRGVRVDHDASHRVPRARDGALRRGHASSRARAGAVD